MNHLKNIKLSNSEKRLAHSKKLKIQAKKRNRRAINYPSLIFINETGSCSEIIIENKAQGQWKSKNSGCLETDENLVLGKPCIIFDLSVTKRVPALAIQTKSRINCVEISSF